MGQLLFSSRVQAGEQFFLVDAKTAQKKVAFDHQKLAAALTLLTEQEIDQKRALFLRHKNNR